jgi:hypothetical protein
MSLLDSPTLAEIELYYKYATVNNGKKLVILDDEKAKALLEDEEKGKEVEVLKTKWNPMTWKEQNEVMNLASQSVNPQTGERTFNFLAYRDAIIKRCLKEWNITMNEKPVPVSPASIDKLPGAVVANLYAKFERLLDYTEEELGN